MPFRPRRSVLYMPAANERALDKARIARRRCAHHRSRGFGRAGSERGGPRPAAAAVRAGGYGSRELVIRINGLDTPWGAADLEAAMAAAPHAILMPKVSQPSDIETPSALLMARRRRPGRTRLWAMVETPLAIINARAIAALPAIGASRLPGDGDQRSPQGNPRRSRRAAASHLCPGSPSRSSPPAPMASTSSTASTMISGRGGISRRMRARPHPRHGRQDADPSKPDRHLQQASFRLRPRTSAGRAR